jgi:hypothetical protein
VDVRLFADALDSPATATQQLTLASSRAAQSNAMTSTISVDHGPTDTEALADQITTFDITTFPGAFIPLLSMLLLGLAAAVAETNRRRGAAATTIPAPPGSAPSRPVPGDRSSSEPTPDDAGSTA